MRTFKFVSLIVVVALLLSACGGGGETQKTGGELKIAILAPLSGPVPTFGVSTRDGALLAVDEWNAKGGVLGMKIVPIVEDSQCTPDPAVNAANKVIDQDKVHYIVGEVCSKASIPVSEIANAKGVVQISGTSTNPGVVRDANGNVKPYTFVACYNDDTQGKAMAKFAFETRGATIRRGQRLGIDRIEPGDISIDAGQQRGHFSRAQRLARWVVGYLANLSLQLSLSRGSFFP